MFHALPISIKYSVWLPDDCVSWEELSCRADGEGVDMRVAPLLELRSLSRDHVWISGLLGPPSGLGRLLEHWLETPLGLAGLLGPSEVPPAADPVGEENCSSLRLVVRKLVLMGQWQVEWYNKWLVWKQHDYNNRIKWGRLFWSPHTIATW